MSNSDKNVIEQLALPITACKERGCTEPVVGSSITGKGHVCKRHNEIEWGRSLLRSKEQWLWQLGAGLVADV